MFTIPFSTFGILYQMIQTHDELESMQIYSHKRQVNILDDHGLSILNIVFYPEEDRVSVFYCKDHGYCDYDNPSDFTFDTNMMLACSNVISKSHGLI